MAEGFEIHIDRPGDPQVLDGPVVPVKQRDMIARFRLKPFKTVLFADDTEEALDWKVLD